MEEAAKPLNRGVLPENSSEKLFENNEARRIHEESAASPNIADNISANENAAQSTDHSETAELTLNLSPYSEYPEYPQEYRHVRSPELRRSEQVILMTAAAVCGAVGGVILALSDKPDPEVLQKLTDASLGGFGSIFLQRTMIGALFLAVEYLLGYFALGDLLVWAAPLVYALGTAFRITALQGWILLPSAIVGAAAVIFGAALSSGFSRSLMRLSSGGTVYLESSPKQKLTISFLGCFAAVLAAAIYEGAILN